MDPGRLIFDSHDHHHGQRMILLGGGGGSPVFRGARPVLEAAASASKRRPFFTSPDELLEEEYYYEEQLPEKKRRLTPEQVHQLERSFEDENKLEPERKTELAKKLGLQPRQVAVWFQNRRARWKNKQLEHDFNRLKSSYSTLLADHDSLLKENDRLRSPMISLTEKLQNKAKAPMAAAGIAETKAEDQAASFTDLASMDVQKKVEDRLSTGSGAGSVVVDGEGPNHLVVSSGESYFPRGYHCMGPADGRLHVEDQDDVGGCNYYSSGIFAAAEHHRQEDDAQLGWWVWN